jgi:hypothetical protein
MKLFRKSDSIGATERELEGLQHRKSQLTVLLSAAEQRLTEATQDRQAKLLESDLANGPPIEVPVFRFVDERDAVVEALAAVDVKLMDAQRRLAEEQDSRRREAVAKELNGVTDELAKVADELAGAIAKVPSTLGAVLDRLPQAVVSRSHTVAFANEVVAALRMVVAESRAHAAQIVSGGAQICEPAAQQPAPPSKPPAIERQSVFLRYAGRWLEGGETVTSGPHTTPELPVEVARLALEYNHGVPADSRAAADLRGLQDPCYAYWPADRCIDLTQPRSAPQPAGEDATAPSVHSGFTRQPIVGTATVR